ncbi:MAG: EscU/YscU/HrcU family type III secretion system export apparatus switch protein [Candidatus Hydrogenedentes bacterium]|nr:EscU/YscU/HrcU family type III secretion system export apparatus switch protein [Candidatus Hydrogenedentota bacterium]
MKETNDRIARKAVALHYDTESDAAPRVVAKGNRLLAERIIEIAKQNDIPIHEDPDLVAILSVLDLDREIPDALYRAVAEVLAFVYTVNQRVREP